MSITFNPFTGNFDFVGTSSGGSSADNFSYHTIPASTLITIPTNQQMILTGDLDVEGELIVDGMLVIDDFVDENNFFPPYNIAVGEVYKVAARKQFFSAVSLEIDGELQIDGLLLIGA
jgi:hypothetical protein